MLQCVHIQKSYSQNPWTSLLHKKQEHRVLSDINFSMKEGESAGLFGLNGSGKSSLIRLILGLEKPNSGDIFFEKKNIQEMISQKDKSLRKNMQAVFQNPMQSMNPRFTAFEVLEEALSNFTLKELQLEEHQNTKQTKKDLFREYAKKCLEDVELKGNILDKNITQFSGGEQQRICLARAMCLKPKLLILDEALSHLDILIQGQIIELLQHLRKSHKVSLLTVSHDIRVLQKLSDTILILKEGKIVEEKRK